MKKIAFNLCYLLLLVILNNKTTLSQISDNYYELYKIQKDFFDSVAQAENKDVWEIEGYIDFVRWADFFKNRNGDNGSIGEYVNALQNYYDNGDNFDVGDYLSEWTYTGHHELMKNHNGSYDNRVGQGWINCIWVNPENIDHILAGSYNGGIWKTITGGDIWESLTDEYEELKAVKSLYVMPNNINKIYLATTTLDQYSTGLFWTDNGGETWTQNQVNVVGEGEYYPTALKTRLPNKWIINPDNDQEMWLITYTQVLRSIDGGISWNIIVDRETEYQTGTYSIWLHNIGFRDIEFDPSNNSIVYASGYEVFKIYNQGNNYDNLTSLLLDGYGYPTDGAKRIFMGTNENYPNKIWFSIYTKMDASNQSAGILEYYNTQTNEKFHLATDSKIKNDWTMQCEVSPVNEGHIIVGGVRKAMYMDEAAPDKVVYISENVVAADDPNWIHSDIRDVCILESESREVVFSGNDGSVSRGIYFGPTGYLWNWDFIGNDGSNGIINGESHGFDCSDSEDDVMYTGFQDMNGAVYNNGIWHHILSGDGSTGFIDETDPNYLYVSLFGGQGGNSELLKSFNKGEDFVHVENIGHRRPALCMHSDNPNCLYVGGLRKLYRFGNIRFDNVYNFLLEIDVDPPLPDPNPNGYSIHGELNITELAIAESNSNVIFCSTERYFPGWANNYLIAKALFRSIDGGTTWTDLSLENAPGLNEGLSRSCITGIVINSYNENEIWICFGNTTSVNNPDDIILHSSDGGDNWQPMSTQPEKIFPGNDLQYEKKTGILYFVNDIGVYLYNSGVNEWQQINNNLPPNVVKFIRFNHALNKIRVATYGRGIWQTDIPCIYNSTAEIISSSDTWLSVKHKYSDIIIEAGCTLTVKNKVFLPENAKIIVKRNAKLLIDGGTLTNACDGLWKGIEIWGTANQNQSELYQGVVQVINGGIIENAECGVQTVKMGIGGDSQEVPDYNYTGGIVICDGGIFKNNKTAVKFWPYDQSPSVSYFRECDFITNDDLIAGTDVEYFIDMSGISGIHILGNSFNDEHFFEEPDELTTGIYAYNSQFYVLPQAGQPNIFSRLYYGIKALATNPVTTLEIENNQFTNNLRSVYLSATNNAHVNLNVFNPWTELLLDPSESYCMYLDHCTGYQVEQNTFTNEVGTHKGIGLIVNQSGSVDNMVYLNYFNNLLYGAIAQNENRNKAGTLGLQFKCNEFTENASDLSVTYLPPKTKSTGIAASQGSGLPSPSAPAGNLFSWTGPQGTPTDINNEAQHVTYYYHNTAPTYKLQPLYYSPLTVSPQGVSAPYNEESCPPDFEGGGGGGGSRETMALAEQKADSLQEIISSLEDGGNTIELKEDVEWSIPPESMVVYNELMNNSPYLTDTVITAAIEKEDVLVNAMIRDVMVANPQSAKDDELIEKLEERNNPVPEYMLGEILQGRNLVSVYEELQSKLSFYTQQRSFTFHSLVYSYLTDTINPGASADSLTVLFNNERTPEAKYSLAFLSMEQGAWSEGLDILNQVSTQFILTEEQQAEQQHLVELCTLLSGLNSTLPDSIQLNELNEIESANAGTGSVYARNILLTLNEIEYNEPVILPGVLKSSEAEKYEQYLQSASEMKYLEVFPNPVQDHVIISWKLNTSTDVKIKITDNTGKNISEIAVNSSENQQVFDTHNLKPGVYIATLIVNGKQTDSAKFTLIK